MLNMAIDSSDGPTRHQEVSFLSLFESGPPVPDLPFPRGPPVQLQLHVRKLTPYEHP
jgi:hypothetical protein